MVTTDISSALEAASHLVADSRTRGDPRAVRIYVTEGPKAAWGESREYYVDHLPPPGKDLVQMFEVQINYKVWELPT